METIETKKNRRPLQICIIIAGAFLYALFTYLVMTDSASAIDDPIRFAFYSLRDTDAAAIMTPFSQSMDFVGGTIQVIVICAILLAIPVTRVHYGLPASCVALGATIINKTVKHIVMRPRPDDIVHLAEEGGYSFASGHSIVSMCMYAVLIYQVRRHVKNKTAANVLTVILCIPMLLMGPSRIYVGVHYPTDVMAGWSLGISIFVVAVLVMEYLRKRRTEKAA